MKAIEITARDKEEAISIFMNDKGFTSPDQFKMEVLDEGSKGLFGIFGGKPARVRFYLAEVNVEANSSGLKTFLESLLKRLEITCDSITTEFDGEGWQVSIQGASDAGFLIGKEGRFLAALQHLAGRYLEKETGGEVRLVLDVDEYRVKREAGLVTRLEPVLDKVLESGRYYTVEPLSARERRIVHQMVEKHGSLRTLTVGMGDRKRVVIFPADQEERVQELVRSKSRRSDGERRNRDGEDDRRGRRGDTRRRSGGNGRRREAAAEGEAGNTEERTPREPRRNNRRDNRPRPQESTEE